MDSSLVFIDVVNGSNPKDSRFLTDKKAKKWRSKDQNSISHLVTITSWGMDVGAIDTLGLPYSFSHLIQPIKNETDHILHVKIHTECSVEQ